MDISYDKLSMFLEDLNTEQLSCPECGHEILKIIPNIFYYRDEDLTPDHNHVSVIFTAKCTSCHHEDYLGKFKEDE